MADKRVMIPLALVSLAAITWYLWSSGGGHNAYPSDEHAFSDISYDPYQHWAIQRGAGFVRHYPTRTGPNCLPQVLAEESQSLTMALQGRDAGTEVDYGRG